MCQIVLKLVGWLVRVTKDLEEGISTKGGLNSRLYMDVVNGVIRFSPTTCLFENQGVISCRPPEHSKASPIVSAVTVWQLGTSGSGWYPVISRTYSCFQLFSFLRSYGSSSSHFELIPSKSWTLTWRTVNFSISC
jgi:hypothetical protein